MSRYFVTTNASLPYNAGGLGFAFEPVTQRGGSWLGVLAVEEDSAANILLSAGFPQVAEITQERYELEKKKAARIPTGSPVSPTRRALAGVAGVAGQNSGHGAKGVDPAKDPNSTAFVTALTLLASKEMPPHEPLIDNQPAARRPRLNHK